MITDAYITATKLLHKADPTVRDYMRRILNGEEFPTNLSSTLIVDSDNDREEIDRIISAYENIYNNPKSKPPADIGTSIVSSAVHLAVMNKPLVKNSFSFALQRLRNDGGIRIPKVGVFYPAERIILPPDKETSTARITRLEDGTYQISITTKNRR